MSTVQLPNNWRPLLEDTSRPLVQLFFTTYCESQPQHASIAMESLVLLSSTRKSIFTSDKGRMVFLTQLMTGIAEILRGQTSTIATLPNDAPRRPRVFDGRPCIYEVACVCIDLQNQSCHHEFCRLLARLRANFQLNLLIQADGYFEWITMVCNFTVKTLHAWQWAPNSTFFLLSTWASLVRGLPFMRPGTPNHVPELVPQVFKAYVISRLESVATCMADDTIEDPLEDEEITKQHLEHLPPIARCTYSTCCEDIVALFDPLATRLQEVVASGAADENLLRQLDGQLAWLIYIIGTIAGGRTPPQSDGTNLYLLACSPLHSSDS